MIRDPRTDAQRDRVARRIIAAESFLLGLCVAAEGWTPYASMRLVQIAAAVSARYLASSRR